MLDNFVEKTLVPMASRFVRKTNLKPIPKPYPRNFFERKCRRKRKVSKVVDDINRHGRRRYMCANTHTRD